MKKMVTTKKEIQDMASAWQQSRALLAAVQLNLFSQVRDGATAEEVAGKAGTDPRCTDRLLAVMVTLGLMDKEGDIYRNGPGAAEFLDESADDYMSNLLHTANTFRNWATLDQAVRKGTSVIDLSWDSDARREAFIEAMHNRAKQDAASLVAMLDLTQVRRSLDVGGGSGVYSMAMCRAQDGLIATVLDLPEVTPLTQRYIAQAGMADRIETKDGDYREAEYGTGYDLIFFSAIVHINSMAENRAIMRKAYAALNPGGVIAVQDFIMDENRLQPAMGAVFALNMIVNTVAGDTYTRNEVSDWLTSAGCEEPDCVKTGQNTAMIVGRKPV